MTTTEHLIPVTATGHSWPDPPAPAAFSGLAGEVVSALAPHTEADPVALLLSLLVAFGNLIGRRAHFLADAARHPLNLFCVLVGATAHARKGASWAQILRLLEAVDPDWVRDCLQQGLASGAGLIHAVRDPVVLRQTAWWKGAPAGSQLVTTDYGVSEKRLLIVETGFARPLHLMTRNANTLSAMLRTAWDTGTLQLLTTARTRAARATGAHLSLIGHLTPEELVRSLPSSDLPGDFTNRFLWACVRRSQCLPDGGDSPDLRPLAKRLAVAATSAREIDRLTRDQTARDFWHEVYPALSQPLLGALGAVLARAAPQVMRLACLYALLDRTPHLQRPHLEAALALWQYCRDSARALFTEPHLPTLPERLLHALQKSSHGLTRHEIDSLLEHNYRSAQVSAALQSLAAQGLAASSRESKGKGRPAERWFAVSRGDEP